MAAPKAPSIRATRTIHLALILGVFSITGVAVFVRLTSEHSMSAEVAQLLPVVVLGLFVSGGAIYVLLRRQVLARVGADKDAAVALVRQDLMPPPVFSLAMLGAALAEGAGLLGAVTLLIGGPWYILVAPALSVALIVAQIPSRARVEALVRGAHS